MPLRLPTSGLTFTVRVDPPQPTVGDVVRVTLFASGEGRAPRYTMAVQDGAALLLESPATVSVDELGSELTWALRASGPGVATLAVTVSYQRLVRLSDGSSYYESASVSSGPVVVRITQAPTPTPSPIPNPTPTLGA